MKTKKCKHKHYDHLADRGSCSAGCICWCIDCGAISVGFDRNEYNWYLPTGKSIDDQNDEKRTV